MATKAIVVNYTPEQTKQLVEAYKATPTRETVDRFAQLFGKGVRSIVAKLSREGVYQKQEYVSKTGAKPVKKDEHADAIAKLANLTEAEADSLTKANKTALEKISALLARAALADAAERDDIAGDTEPQGETA